MSYVIPICIFPFLPSLGTAARAAVIDVAEDIAFVRETAAQLDDAFLVVVAGEFNSGPLACVFESLWVCQSAWREAAVFIFGMNIKGVCLN